MQKKRFTSWTIKQANTVTTVVILVFVIIFAYLLIKENYQDYEKTIYKQEHSVADYGDTQKQLKSLLVKNTLAIVTLSFILFAIMLGLYKIFYALIQNDMHRFLNFFKNAAHKEALLSPDEIFFKEFKEMVLYANEMVKTINQQKLSLKEINLILEKKVQKKTLYLEEANAKLLEEKKFSEEILAAQKEFLRYTVHETNTPLSVILTSIELYEMKNKKDRQLSKIEAAAKNIFNIYDDLSYLVKKDQVPYPKVSIELVSYLSMRIEFFRDVAHLAKIDFEYSSDLDKVYIYFNETKLQRIVDNTITNAIKYTLPEETVFLHVKQTGADVMFSVASKSKIIKNPEKIFDAYYRENNNVKGFGLGLQLVKNICEEDNVRIDIASTDKLTTFEYKFKMMGE
ncbi:HAMP domain-containing histidine kinase [Sulfurimonas sediminis]|uniref:histidine kinase n=1 Tax=Sulfurimonas sediminis TaxID=2590020 RepID=A0A7M1B277_9BACT|nr:HAMP domain-containing sensor histidine kinase [Sulfurimonas sediminis]QOP43869.1 HAMP domain-containing histidine kinase [Sulfurimonas sediminis]